MFCSNCGKTLKSEDTRCPHCGMALGESRFEGNGYTAVQGRSAPGDQPREEARFTPYTRTTYTSEGATEDADVYSRTTYRPILADEEEAPAAEPAEAAPEADAPEEPEAAPKAQSPAPAEETAPVAVDENGEIKVAPLAPIKLPGISAEVEERMQRLKNKGKGKPEGRSPATPIKRARKRPEPIEDDEEEEEVRPSRAKRASAGKPDAMRLVRMIAAAAAILALVVVGVIYLGYITADRAPIAGVSYDLYTRGLTMIKDRASDSYRLSILNLYKNDNSGATAMAKQAEDKQAIEALMPTNPQENDRLYVDTLLDIQNSIDIATTMDAIAAMNASDPSLASLGDESASEWKIINNAVKRVETATTVVELQAIGSDAEIILKTPEPEASPTPEVYKTLKKNDKNSSAVKKLQNRLYELGYFSSVRDGDFGSITQTAVKKFQQAAGLTVDGIATAEVQELLYSESAPYNPAKATPAPTVAPAAAGDEAADK